MESAKSAEFNLAFAATSDEIAAAPGGCLCRTVCGQAIVFYGDGNGAIHGLEDWCPHRGTPPPSPGCCSGQVLS